MAAEQRKCPYCGMSMAADQRSCPDCGNPYPFDDDAPPEPQTGPFRPQRADVSRSGGSGGVAASAAPGSSRAPGRGSGLLEAIAPYRTALVLATVLILIVVVAYVLFSVVMSFFGERRPDPSTLPTPIAGPALVPPGASPVAGASPSPVAGGGTMLSPAASPSPSSASGVKMKVARTENQGANMRQRPSTTAPVVKVLPEGTVIEVIGGETNAEGRNWRNIRESGGQTGWVASELLMPE